MTYIILTILLWLLVVASFGFYKAPLGRNVKLITLPALLVFSILLSWHYMSSLGRPVMHEPYGEWEYVHHVAYTDTVELWAIDDVGARLYIFYASDEVMDKLRQAQGMKEEGQTMVGEFKQEGNDGDNDDESDVLTIVNRPPQTNDKGI